MLIYQKHVKTDLKTRFDIAAHHFNRIAHEVEERKVDWGYFLFRDLDLVVEETLEITEFRKRADLMSLMRRFGHQRLF